MTNVANQMMMNDAFGGIPRDRHLDVGRQTAVNRGCQGLDVTPFYPADEGDIQIEDLGQRRHQTLKELISTDGIGHCICHSPQSSLQRTAISRILIVENDAVFPMDTFVADDCVHQDWLPVGGIENDFNR